MSTLLTKIAKAIYTLILLIFGRLFKTLPKRPQGVIFRSEAIAYEYLQRQVAQHNRRMFRLIICCLSVFMTALIFFIYGDV